MENDANTLKVIYIPGAFSGKDTFNHIRQNTILKFCEYEVFQYDITQTPLALILKHLVETIHKESNYHDVLLVGHSYGGMLARLVMIYNPDLALDVKGVITLSSPHSGFDPMTTNPATMFGQNVSSLNPTIYHAVGKWFGGKEVSFLNVVGDKGVNHLLMSNSDDNDTVVPVSSQVLKDKGVEELRFHLNHFEILLSDEVTDGIDEFLSRRMAPWFSSLGEPFYEGVRRYDYFR